MIATFLCNNNTPPKLLDQVRDRICVKHYSIRTETQYVRWIKRFILFNCKRHPVEMGAAEVVTMLPESLKDSLLAHLHLRCTLFDNDTRLGKASVYLPDALERKYPNAVTDWVWQYIFPSGSLSVDPRSGVECCHHIDEKILQRAMKKAVQTSGIAKLATPHTLRHSFAAYLKDTQPNRSNK